MSRLSTDRVSAAINDLLVWADYHKGAQAVGVRSEEYGETIFPFDDPVWRVGAEADGKSSCGLFMLAGWWHVGVKHRLRGLPFVKHGGQSLPDVQTIAREAGALHQFGDGAGTPEPGDYVILNDDPPNPRFDRGHGLIVTSYEPMFGTETARVESIDGGQAGDLGGYAIKARTRWFQLIGGKVWAFNDEACKAIDRRVWWWIDTAKVIEVFGE